MKQIDEGRPHLIITVGIPGAGKSRFAEHFSETFKAPLVSFEKFMNITKDKTVASRCVIYTLSEVLKTNHTVVYDGKTASRVARAAVIKKAIKSGYIPLIIWIQTDPKTAIKRLSKKVNKDITQKQFKTLEEVFQEPRLNEDDIVVISGKYSYSNQLKIVLKRLADNKATEKN